MSIRFTEENIEDFLTRFYHCYDGVVQNVVVDLFGGAFDYTATVILHVKDASDEQGNWVELKLIFSQVDRFAIRHETGFIQVLSGGVSVFFSSDLLCFDLTFDETKTSKDLKQSDFYFRAKNGSWEVVKPLTV